MYMIPLLDLAGSDRRWSEAESAVHSEKREASRLKSLVGMCMYKLRGGVWEGNSDKRENV